MELLKETSVAGFLRQVVSVSTSFSLLAWIHTRWLDRYYLGIKACQQLGAIGLGAQRIAGLPREYKTTSTALSPRVDHSTTLQQDGGGFPPPSSPLRKKST
jgi:hypothetical protein